MRWLCLILLLAACKGPAEAPHDHDHGHDHGVEEPAREVPDKVDFKAVTNEGRTAMFVPAPTEFEAVLKANAPGADLKSMVPSGTRSLEGLSRPLIALETGTRITAALLTADPTDKAALVVRTKAAREGLVALQAGEGALKEVDAFLADLESGRLTGAELTPALDVLSERIHDALATNADAETATLVQAGGWVQGAHLLAQALGRGEITPDAAALFSQGSLVHHFEFFLKASDAGRAGDPRVATVIEKIGELRWIAGQDPITAEHVKQIERLTGEIIGAFRQAE
jgi:hypothetical protein